MFTSTILQKYAEVLIWGMKISRKNLGGRFKKGDIIYLAYDLAGVKLAELIYAKLTAEGFNVLQRMTPTPIMQVGFYGHANEKQLKFSPSWGKAMINDLGGYIRIDAPASLTHLSHIDPSRISMAASLSKQMRELKRIKEPKGLFGWTIGIMPTSELAKQADMSLKEYSKEVLTACYLNKKDPVSIWQNIQEETNAIKAWLDSLPIKNIHIESKNIDLTIGLGEKRRWLGGSGHNIPSFEIYTSPDYRKTRGTFYSNSKSFIDGNIVEGVRLEFSGGRVIKATAKTGQKFTRAFLKTDLGASRVGEFSLTDKRFSPIKRFMASTLFDENVGGQYGNCHIALGVGFTDTIIGSKSLTKKAMDKHGLNYSLTHWDLINTERKRVTVKLKDGKTITIYENGEFTY